MSAVDISTADFNVPTEGSTPTYVMLPPEDPEHRDSCGLLKKTMYGARAAAGGQQQEYAGFMRALGFRQGEAGPCMFINVEKELAVSVHGDDFTSTKPNCKLDCFEDKLRRSTS